MVLGSSNLKSKGKVFVGMSGGVDSSVSALLLKKAGYEVTGVFIKVWQPEFFECTWRQDRLDAMRVCAKLDIPFVTLNLEDEYKNEVVDYMIEEYKRGRTPNPDVMCNKYVKFGGFFDWAMEQGADYVATGHYARVAQVESKKLKVESKIQNKKLYELYNFQLLTGRDGNKDQSYFLWTLTQTQLSKTLFPIGDIKKPEVRRLAEKYGLSTAIKKDSQGLCFIGKIDIKDFLKNYIKEKKGKVLLDPSEVEGKEKVIGEHDGVFYLTIGQRHGFKVTQTHADVTQKNADIGPYYIISKNIKDNTIIVSQDPTKVLEKENKIVKLKNVNWTLGETPDLSKKYSARIRYRQPLEECEIVRISNMEYGISNKNSTFDIQDSAYELHFIKSQKAITPGQSAVIYDGEVCLGGGVIS
jgi:tRNA-specific 2-thiouridylase